MAGACWCGVGSIPGVDLAVVASSRGTVRWCDATPAHSLTGLHAPRGSQLTRYLSVVPFLPLLGRPTRRRLRRNMLPKLTAPILVDRRAAGRRPPAQSAAACARPTKTTGHARRAQLGVPMVGEGPACGRRNGDTVFLTGAFRALRRRRAKHASRQDTQEAQTRALEKDQALPPPHHHRRRGLRIPRRTAGDFTSSTVGLPPSLGIGNATVWNCLGPHDGLFGMERLPLFTDVPCATH
ncbi:hypothetical protein MOQ_007367 [Trypanosoma cruzi marinkellei]|uniref:Uncharacterized protein n=1 Tax=Trypanosoma cruzi marinkellei TaxID=85056 RepID=K2MT63_TRYCR|nr:hypothetical protein MOQ_007367 [Trypanosoma cruzi marinkellei]